MKWRRKINESGFKKNINIEISTEALSMKNDRLCIKGSEFENFQTGLVKTRFDRIYDNV